jgi:hypothetical protein
MFSVKHKFDEKNRIANKKRDIGDETVAQASQPRRLEARCANEKQAATVGSGEGLHNSSQ